MQTSYPYPNPSLPSAWLISVPSSLSAHPTGVAGPAKRRSRNGTTKKVVIIHLFSIDSTYAMTTMDNLWIDKNQLLSLFFLNLLITLLEPMLFGVFMNR